MAERASSTAAEAAICVAEMEEGEEEQARENEGDVVMGLRRVRQKVKDEDQRGQGWDLGNRLGAKWG